jgi:glycyl-tRNA synthetase
VPATDLETIVSLAKRRGFVFPSAEIYGGFANTYDYGPLGVELKRNIRNEWWKAMVQERDDVVGLDAALLSNPKVWVASGHVSNFNDPMADCKSCKNRFRVDHIEEGQYGEVKYNAAGELVCPNCGGELTE